MMICPGSGSLREAHAADMVDMGTVRLALFRSIHAIRARCEALAAHGRCTSDMAKRVTAKEVNRAGTDWQKQIELYGERSLSSERAFQRYMELKTLWEKQNGKI